MPQWAQGGLPPAEGVWVDRGPWAAAAAVHLHVRHPGWEWLDEVPETALRAGATDGLLAKAALAYLQALRPYAMRELAPLVARLGAGGAPPFGWLPLKWSLNDEPPGDRDPHASFVLARRDRSTSLAGRWLDGHLVMLAGHRLPGTGLALGDGVGLRVTAAIGGERASGLRTLRFTSLNATRLDEVMDTLPDWVKGLCTPDSTRALRDQLDTLLDLRHPAVHAMRRVPGSDNWRLLGSGTRFRQRLPGDPARHVPRAPTLEFEVEVDPAGGIVSLGRIEEPGSRMASAGATLLDLFERDPASQVKAADIDSVRPGRLAAELNERRDFVTQSSSSTTPDLDLKDEHFFVSHERTSPAFSKRHGTSKTGKKIARLRKRPSRPKGTRGEWLPLRSDDLSAAQAYFRAREFFERLKAYGFAAPTYFRHADLPLELRARARLPGAADGHAVNANVRPFFAEAQDSEGLLSHSLAGHSHRRSSLVVRFGSADSNVSDGVQTLGLAADPRWAWHEFGHVLNYAATGELELPFAHSAGDALAAIAADPDSLLAADNATRGMTFPWAYVPRRHDRSARLGHCWCGQRIGSLRGCSATWAGYRHGYFEEQLLSSSLFRLYLAIGGATGAFEDASRKTLDDADARVRRSASDYCIYLIMRAIGLLGPNGVAPAAAPDQLVGALMDADLGTGSWSITAPWPYREGAERSVERRGGRVHKVIRWAFEQQGLYAVGAEGSAEREGAGRPPPVDFYIADRRRRPGSAAGDGAGHGAGDSAGEGGYWPVPLRWDDTGEADWYAAPDAFEVGTPGEVGVRVLHRGTVAPPPSGSTVALWSGRRSGKGWRWRRCEPASGRHRFEVAIDQRGPGTWWLASVDHPADRANLRPDEDPPADSEALIELVANDNNLALARAR